jgi:hypothetical protein
MTYSQQVKEASTHVTGVIVPFVGSGLQKSVSGGAIKDVEKSPEGNKHRLR